VAVGGVVIAFSLACSEPYQVMDDSEPCVQVGYSISSTTFRCTGSEATANRRFHAYEGAYSCTNRWASASEVEPSFQCAIDLEALSCADEAAFGNDLSQWLAASPSCAALFEGGTGDTGVTP